MSVFEGLEAALDEAAQRHYGRRRLRPHLPSALAGAVAVAAAVAAVVLTGASRPQSPPAVPAQELPLTVPAATLARSSALTTAAPQPQTLVEHGALNATAAALEAAVPYPPGASDDYDWAVTPDNPRDMASINFRDDLEGLIDFRAACLWTSFWLYAHGRGDAGALAGATTVLNDVSRWPAMRGAGDGAAYWSTLARHAAAGEPGPLRAAVALNCDSVHVPWR